MLKEWVLVFALNMPSQPAQSSFDLQNENTVELIQQEFVAPGGATKAECESFLSKLEEGNEKYNIPKNTILMPWPGTQMPVAFEIGEMRCEKRDALPSASDKEVNSFMKRFGG